MDKRNKDKKQYSVTGGSSNYYKIVCVDDDGKEYTTEAKHIINAKNMSFNQANNLKVCFRLGNKEGVDEEYDLDKQLYFIAEEQRRLGFVKNNQELIDKFKKIIGEV